MIHPLLFNAQRADENSEFKLPMNSVTFAAEGISTAIVRYILAKYPNSFNDVNFLMSAPVDLVHSQQVGAITLPLDTSYTFEMAAALSTSATKQDMITLVIETLAESIASELFIVRDALAKEDKVMCPYELVGAYRGVNHNTFEPEIRFRTRYGIYDPKAPQSYD